MLWILWKGDLLSGWVMFYLKSATSIKIWLFFCCSSTHNPDFVPIRQTIKSNPGGGESPRLVYFVRNIFKLVEYAKFIECTKYFFAAITVTWNEVFFYFFTIFPAVEKSNIEILSNSGYHFAGQTVTGWNIREKNANERKLWRKIVNGKKL